MEPFDPWRRMGSHGRLLDVSLLRALLVPGPDGAAHWIGWSRWAVAADGECLERAGV